MAWKYTNKYQTAGKISENQFTDLMEEDWNNVLKNISVDLCLNGGNVNTNTSTINTAVVTACAWMTEESWVIYHHISSTGP